MTISAHISFDAWQDRIKAALVMEWIEAGVSAEDIALARSMRGAFRTALQAGRETDLILGRAGEGMRPFLAVVGGRDVE